MPSTGNGRTVRTFTLARLAPQDALAKLTQLYAELPEDRRPTVLALDEVGKVTLVGSLAELNEAASLLAEIDGGTVESPAPERSLTVVALAHSVPQEVAAAVRSLLNGRQLVAIKMIPGPDRESLIISGLAGDVAAVEALVPLIDRPAALDRQVRLVRLTTDRPEETLAKARDLYEKQVDPTEPKWAAGFELDNESRLLTMFGPPAALDRFAEALRLVETNAVIDRETRQVELAHATPSRVAAPLAALGRQLLDKRDGTPFVAPQIDPLDPLHSLVVTAVPEQFAVLESLIETLDRPSAEDFQLRVIPLAGTDAQALMEKADYVYDRLSEGRNPKEWPPPATDFDPLTGNLLVTGRTESVQTYERAVTEGRRLLPPAATGRLLELTNAQASEVVGPLRELIATTAPVDPARAVPEPTIELIERTNSLYVVAEPAQHDMIERYVRQLDTYEPSELPPLRLLQVRAADAAQLANMLRKRYGARPAQQRREEPVEIDADAATNTLIVTAHQEMFEEIKDLVETVNRSGETEADRETMLFPLQRARATDLAQALERLYPQPPMPLDRRGRPLPHLQKPKEVHVSADRATNTLIVEAPAARQAQFEALVAQLDRVELPPRAELRTYHIERGDPNQIARTLVELARQGVLSAPPDDGGKAVDVTIQAEPVSRTLIVAGDEVTFAKTQEMLRDLQAVPVQRSLRVFEVTGADPQEIADRAQRLYEEQTADVPDATAVSVEVDRESSALLVVADDEAMIRFVSILNELQASIGPPPDVRLVGLEYADAAEVVGFLQDLAEGDVVMIGGRGGPPPVFQAVERTNSVLIAARPDQQAIVRALVQSLDKPDAQEMPPLRILQLRTADAQNLSSALMRQYAQRHPDDRRDRPVSITADPQTNALIVAAHPEMLPDIQAVVEALNRADRLDEEGREIRIFPLKVARAEELARTIDEMFPQPPVPRDRRGRPLYHLQPRREVVVRADPQTNALIVDAPIQRMVGFEKLVEQLDRQQIAEETEIRAYRVVNADLNAVATTLRQLAADGSLSPGRQDRRAPTTITTEPMSRSIVVAGAADIFDRVEEVLGELDSRHVGPATTLRFFKLENARAESLVPMLRQILIRRITEDVEDAGPDVEMLLNLSADRKTNTLIISAPAAIMPVAEALVKELDHPRAAVDVVDVRIFQLAQADANQVAQAVRTAVEAEATAAGEDSEATIAAEPSSNSIVVTAPPTRMARIEPLIEALDDTLPADQLQVRTVFLKYARAETVAPLVEQLLAREEVLDLNRLPSWSRVGFYQMQLQRGGPEPTVRVAADPRLNAVVISAPSTLLNVAEQMIAQLDVDRARLEGAARRSVRILVIENTDAGELASNLDALFEEEGKLDPPPTIRVDRVSNSLLVLATDGQFKTMEQVVQQIDRATIAASRQMRLIPIDPATASAEELARALKRMLKRRGGRDVEVITVDQLLERRERSKEPKPSGPTSALPMPIWPAFAALALTVQAEDAAPDAESDEETGLTIAVDPATNSLIVVGAPRAIDRVANLARQLVQQLPAAPGRIHYVALPPGVDANSASRLVLQTLSQMTPPGGRRGALRWRVAVVADPTNNALIVVSNDVDFEIVGDLIAALSRPTTTDEIVVKVYSLATVTADRAAESVRQMLAPDGQARRRGRQAQRMRDLAVTLLVEDQTIEGVFNPDRVRVTADPQSNALIVMGPPASIGFVDRFIELLDQTPVNVQTTLKLYPLKHAQAAELRNTLRNIFRTRYQSLRGRAGASALQPEFAADERTNTLLVTAAPEQLAEVDALLADLDRKLGDDLRPLRIMELTAAQPQQAADILKRVVIGTDQARRATTLIVPDDPTGVLLVRAPDDVMAEIESVLSEIDRRPTSQYKVRTILLERADAAAVASAVQRFYDDRARIASAGRGRREQARRVSIIGDRNSNTLLVAASDEDYSEIEGLVAQFDTPQASQALGFRVFALEHAKATEIQQTVQNLVNDLTWNQGFFFFISGRSRDAQRRSQGTVAVRADARLNALIVTGEGDKFDVVEKLIEVLDAPQPEGEQRLVRLYQLKNADVNVVADVVRETYTDTTRRRRWWEPPDPTEIKIRTDVPSKSLIISGSVRQHEDIAELIASIDEQVAPGEQRFSVLPVEFAQAPDLARTLNDFLRRRARATRSPPSTTTIVASQSANTLIVSAEAEDLATIRDLLGRLDQPDVSGDRAVEIVALIDGDAEEIARIIRQQFSRRGGTGVIVTPDVRTNSLIVNAPKREYAQARALIDRLDAPSASDETIIRTYALEGARADEAVRILGDTLQLDERGETAGITIKLEESDAPAVEVKAKIVADRRSNSLVVTATEESFPVIEALVAKIDDVPAASPIEYRIIPLKHAVAVDVSFTLAQFVRGRGRRDGQEQPRIDYNRLENQLIIAATADQFEQIQRIIAEIDQPSQKARITDFVPLEFAQAEQVQEALSVFYGPLAYEADTPGKINARIVADPASNSLVITADESEWANIRALLEKLDSEEYDVSLQLRVIPLTYADARSVARAINEAFEAQLPRGRRGAPREPRRSGIEGERREPEYPAVLVEAEEWVRASAEPLTNSVIVSASRQSIGKIEQIVTQLDVADYAKLPPPQIIPVTAGSPEQLAESLTRLYEQAGGDRGRKGLRIVGDNASSTIVVRAETEEFLQIKALAEALQDEASEQGLSVHVVKLAAAPAGRVADAIADAFEAKARQTNQPLAIQVDRPGNTLVVACTAALFAEVKATVDQLDRLAPAAGQGIFIIELEHVSPEAATEVIQTIGLDKPQRDDSVSRLVTEPITISPLAGRNAVIVVANPIDRDTIVGLLKAIDSEPRLAEARVRVVKLHNARADALADILRRIFAPGEQQADTPLAQAVREQVRRLSVRRDGLGDGDLQLDLTKPIRVIADSALNALVISSTAPNVEALAELVVMFDELPITDAVTVQLFPLENIAAEQFARIVRDLFSQGKALGGVPGTDLEGVPGGTVGRALLEEIAVSVDERTNTVVVAGKEDAVALVEVLSKRIDADVATGWIEPRILWLRYADASDLAETLGAILVEGAQDRVQSSPLQRQVARLRMARIKENGGRVLEADLFSPMTRLVIRPEPQLNALVLVGTPMNLEVVTELVQMLDIEAASPGATVRIYPLEHASAARLAATITRLFDQQVQTRAIRREDRVIVQADERTNALVVTTSPRSFVVLEPLLETLDARIAPELGAIRRIELANASASRVAALVQQLMDARLERLRRIEPETAELQRATVVADLRTNSLIVGAGNESFEVIERLATDLDRQTLSDRALIKMLTVGKGNVEGIAETVNALMERRYAEMPDELRRSQQPLVLTDLRSNSLLVAANPEDLTSIEDLVDKLEAAPINPAVGLHVIPLETTRAELLAPRLQALMRQRQQSLGTARTPADRVTIEPDTASNSLIVAASQDNLQVVRDLIEALIKAEAGTIGDATIEVLQLASSRAADVVDLLDSMYVRDANRSRGPDTVRVTADERLNAVLINAPPADVGAIKRLVAQLDGARPATVVEIKYIPLTSANPLETVSLIENVLSGRGIGTRRTSRQATVMKYLREFAIGQMGNGQEPMLTEMEVSAAIRESILLTPDLRTNTVIVSAPRESMTMIEQMIRDLDASSTGAQNIRIFKLKNADALAMAEILTDLLNLARRGNLYVLRPRERAVPEEEAATEPPTADTGAVYAGLLGTELTAVPDDRQQLSITVDSRTNSLLVSGTPIYLDLVEEVVEELDALEANEREVFVYQLRNSVAAEVARVITAFVEQEQQKLISTLSVDQIGSAARLLEREITIVGDELSNTVLVSSSPRYMERVRNMIAELDVDPPQVLIQVLLAEITLDALDEWAVDFTGAVEVGKATVAGDFGLGVLGSAFINAIGAPSLSVTTSDFNLLLRALESQGRLQVLSNPSVMAANNQPARIQIGENIGRASSSRLSEGGVQQTDVEFEDIGVILDVTPSINPDGFVRMVITPEITDLTNRTTQITEDLEVQILTKRTATTTVTVRDGQTIVIGGLISDQWEQRVRKVPLLGDVPVLGKLFRSEFEDSTTTELLIVLTPHVITSPAELNRVRELTDGEIDRLSLSPREKDGLRRSRLDYVEHKSLLDGEKEAEGDEATERRSDEGQE
ncbi:MAG: secretin N-terminal domain-containing protein [Planctomycetota bacterium]